MSVIEKVKCLVYRVHEKGLEVLLVATESMEKKKIEEESWDFLELKQSELQKKEELESGEKGIINLEPIKDRDGRITRAVAIEGDWHDLPSIRKMFFKDVDTLKTKLKSYVHALESGMYVGVNEAVSKVVSDSNPFLVELKEIVAEKHSTRDM